MNEDRLKEIQISIKRIEGALVGDETLGHKGIVKRLTEAELKQEATDGEVRKIDRKLAVWSGAATGASLIIGYVKGRLFGP